MDVWLASTALGVSSLCAGLFSAATLHPKSPLGRPVVRAASGVRLTFDDGPDPEWTPRVLQRLDAVGAKASFFVVGERVRRWPELVRECAAEGHRIEIHGERHRAATLQWPSRLAEELRELGDAIEGLSSRRPEWYRPPYGARPLWASSYRPLRLVTWSWSCGDWAGAAAARRPLPGVRPGEILLLHDGPTTDPVARQRTLSALDELAASGHTLSPLD